MACRLVSTGSLTAPARRVLCTQTTLSIAATSSVLSWPARAMSTATAFRPTVPVMSSSFAPTAAGGVGQGRGKGFASDRSSAGTGSSGTSIGAVHPNSTHDGILSADTRRVLRDDTIIVEEVFRHMPNDGAIAVKSLATCLRPEVQEALSEKHGGLLPFLRDRQQLFLVKERPEDGKVYVAGNPIAARRFHVRSLQKTTVRQLMGLDDASAAKGRHGQRRAPPRSGGTASRGSSTFNTGRGPRDRQRGPSPSLPSQSRVRAPPHAPSAKSAPRRQQFGA